MQLSQAARNATTALVQKACVKYSVVTGSAAPASPLTFHS